MTLMLSDALVTSLYTTVLQENASKVHIALWGSSFFCLLRLIYSSACFDHTQNLKLYFPPELYISGNIKNVIHGSVYAPQQR